MNKGLTPLLLLLVAGLVSCGRRKVYLGNNTTAVPKNTKAYKNRVRFDSSVLKDIDTSMMYEEIGYYHMDSLWIRKDLFTSHYIYYGVLRFYSNGFVNEFIVDSTKPLTPKNFDPAYAGYRGVYYRKKSHIQLELLGPVNGLQHMGKLIFYIET